MTQPPFTEASGPPAVAFNANVGVAYRVLARKYRPTSFAELIGQEALVRTLSNALTLGRIAQAFMLTGVRGVGKTTTARIIARALNCVGPDGAGGPTVSPCDVCVHCRAIAEDRHVDVFEMDAASHTGVEDIREIIDGSRYAPSSARYKLYIIDEVHMLSKNAFNALLKTLEEPPPHVKFVFATTEIRKVPVTILSRCQRFDLRRIETAVLSQHFLRVAEREGVTIEPDAVAMIARAADGSVRDGLSLLDQAIAAGGSFVAANQVREMLGLADRGVIIDLLEAALAGRPRDALDILADLDRRGADPLAVLRDLLDLVHFLSRFKLISETAEDPGAPETERVRGGALANKLPMSILARAWQMLLKGFNEAQSAPRPQQAVEMILIRLAFAADMPPPAELMRRLQNTSSASGAPSGGGRSTPPSGGGANATASPPSPTATSPVAAFSGAGNDSFITARASTGTTSVVGRIESGSVHQSKPRLIGNAEPSSPEIEAPSTPTGPLSEPPADFPALVRLFAERREGTLYAHLYANVHLVRFGPGILEIRPSSQAPVNLANRVSALLYQWTGCRWWVSVSSAPGLPTLSEQENATVEKERQEAAQHPVVRAVLETFPGARISDIRKLTLTVSDETENDSDSDAAAEFSADLETIDEEGEFWSL
ncbi:DNA polymerase III subunit gamma/tau [Azospirillaceae bacterium]